MREAREFSEANIAIIDDEPANVALLRAALGKAGYRNLTCYDNGSDAYAALATDLPDVVLLDVNMPGMSGVEVLSALTTVHTDTFLPVIVLTADRTAGVRDEALLLGAADYLLKPFNITELLLRVANVARTRRLQVQLEAERVALEARVVERTRDLQLANDALLKEKHAVERMRAAERELEQRLRYLAFNDTLTGLANRTQLAERLQDSVGSSRYPTGLLLLDIDDFKSLNDTVGHSAGDAALRRVADVLRESAGIGDLASRLGGDEFAVLTTRPDAEQHLLGLAHAVSEALEQAFIVDGREIRLRCSVGIDIVDPGSVTSEELMRRADVALYVSKGRKPSPPSLYEPAMDEALTNRLALISGFGDALAHDQFTLFYQPIVRLPFGQPAGFEALIRWNHPVLGRLAPDRFIPISEDSGWIRRIGQWATQQAIEFIHQMRQLPGFEHTYVAVNASPIELRESDFASHLGMALDRGGVASSQFVVEVTERVVMNAPQDDRALSMLSELRALGVGIALDDFGTGYSSLSYLRSMPLTTLKIDKSFVQGIGRGGREEQIVTCIIALARAMSLNTTSEGVEEQHQAAWLAGAGCQTAQGYLFGRPEPAESLLARARQQRAPAA